MDFTTVFDKLHNLIHGVIFIAMTSLSELKSLNTKHLELTEVI